MEFLLKIKRFLLKKQTFTPLLARSLAFFCYTKDENNLGMCKDIQSQVWKSSPPHPFLGVEGGSKWIPAPGNRSRKGAFAKMAAWPACTYVRKWVLHTCKRTLYYLNLESFYWIYQFVYWLYGFSIKCIDFSFLNLLICH